MRAAEETLLKNSFFLYICAIILMVGLGLIVYIDASIKRHIVSKYQHDIELELNQRTAQLLNSLNAARDAIDFFHTTPPIKAIARARLNDDTDPRDGTAVEVWYERLETIFEGYLENSEYLDMARLIQYDEEGSELLRVEQFKENIRVVPQNRLQKKSQHDYYQQASRLNPEEIYVSPINLNREWGKVEVPFRPTYRVARNIYHENNEAFGFLILNIDAKLILDIIQADLLERFKLYLVNNSGGVIIHPDADQAFLFEFEAGHTWTDVKARQGSGVFKQMSMIPVVLPGKEDNFYFLEKSINLASSSGDNQLTMIIGFNESDFNAELATQRSFTVVIIGILIVLILALLVFYQRWVMRRLAIVHREAEFEAIVHGSNDAIISMDKDGCIESWNRAAEDIFGYPERSAINKQIFELLIDEDKSQFSQDLLKRVFAGESIPAFNVNAHGQRGKALVVSITMSPIKPPSSDEVISAAAIIRDVTNQKAIEKEVLELNSSLEQQVAERTRELETARNEALQVSRVKSDFIASVSHEIRTPMNGVIGMLHLIEKEALSEQQRSYLAMASTSASALTVLIDDILDLSKIEAGKLEIETREFDVIDTVGGICSSLALAARNKGLQLICDLSEISHPQIISDDNRIRQVLMNLVNNAIKFTSEGKVVVRGKTDLIDNGKVQLEMSVRDTGIGIEQTKQSTLFQSFSQADTTTSRQYGGTGLGLAISKKLCELLGGDISVESKPRQGSVFTFIVEAQVNEDAEELGDTCLYIAHCKIFIKGDDADINTSLASTLSRVCKNIAVVESTPLNWVGEIVARQQQGLSSILYCFDGDSGCVDLSSGDYLQLIYLSDDYVSASQQLESVLQIPFTPYAIFKSLDHGHDNDGACNSAVEYLPNLAETNGELLALLKAHRDKRILLVDDNEINLSVGRGIMEDYHLRVDTAAEGQEAILKLEQSHYDLVLMDCQMPVMDGYETTKVIRKEAFNSRLARLPIIAMTANAMSGSRDKCLACGMNDYITKPIDPIELAEKVLFWLSLPASALPVGVKSDDEKLDTHTNAEASLPVPKPCELSKDETLIWDRPDVMRRLKNREDRLRILLDMFVSNTPERIERLENFSKHRDYEQVAFVAHEIKGTAGNIGAVRLFSLTDEIEALSHAANTDHAQANIIDALVASCAPEYDNFVHVLKSHYGDAF